MKRTIITMVMLCCISVFAQTITIKDKTNNEPIANVQLTIANQYYYSNEAGQIIINQISKTDSLMFEHPEFAILVIDFNTLFKNQFDVELNKILTLKTVVLSATRWKQNSDNVPSKITKITTKERQLMNPQTAADLLAVSGEVFIQKSQQGGGSPMIRGFSTNRLLYSLDGVRMNTAIFRAENIQNVISLDPYSIQNTEVFFGPGSIIYGSDAIGGVMSFNTLKPMFSELDDKTLVKGNSSVRHSGANNEKTYHFDVNVGWKKWAFLSSFTSSDFGDLRMGAKNGPKDYLRHSYVVRQDSVDRIIDNTNPLIQKPTAYSQINLMQKIAFKPNNKWYFKYGFHYSETSEFSRYDRLIETSNGLPSSAVWNYGPQKWMMNLLSIQYLQKTKLFDAFSVKLAHQYFEESRINRNFSGGSRFRLRTQTEKVDAVSLNADFEKRIGKHQLFYGLEGVHNKVISKGEAYHIKTLANIPTASRYPNSDWNSYAFYVNYQYQMSQKLTIQSGLRYNYFDLFSDFMNNLAFYPYSFNESSIKNSNTNGSIGAVYSATKNFKINANLSTGFRAPNVDDIGKIFDFGANDIVLPNPNLKAENAINSELNISKVYGRFLKVDLTGFYTILNQAMVRRAFQVNGQDSIMYDGQMRKSFAIQNAAKAEIMGANIGVEIKLPKGFSIESRYNYQKGTEEMDNGAKSSSRHAAPAFGITKLTFSNKMVQLQFYAMYSAAVTYNNLNEEERQKQFIYTKDENGKPYSPSWMTLNFKSNVNVRDYLSIQAGVENLLDKRYRPYSSGLVAPGRNLVISLNLKF